MKQLLTDAPILHYYDPELPVMVAADASSYGLGAVLYQTKEGMRHPVAYASRTLLSSEQRYAAIEKECLAGMWACKKFNRFVIALPSFALLVHPGDRKSVK